MRKRLNIAIVGCGVAGCTAAIYLARGGHRVTMFEQSPHIGPVGAGILLQPSGQRVLSELGLLDAVTAGAEKIHELLAHTHRGRVLSQLRFADRSETEIAYGLHRGDLFTVLHGELLRTGVEIRLNHAIADVDPSRGLLRRATGDDFGAFDLIVAADGSRSPMRRASGLWFACYEYEPAALWAVGFDPNLTQRLFQVTRFTHKLCGLLPMGGGRASFFWGINRRDWPAVKHGSFGVWKDHVLRLVPQAGTILDEFESFEQLRFTTYRAVWMPRPTVGRLVFIGDAAHGSSPLLGHGVNLAMCDARQLCRSIESQKSLAAALNHYSSRQRFRNDYYSLLSLVLAPTFQGQSILLGAARDAALLKLQRIAPLRQLMLATLMGVVR